jgi:ribosomal protein S18 acetylase RimI-like enzyme
VAVEIVRFVPADHEAGAIEALRTLRAAGIEYPPRQDTDDSQDSLSAWLNDGVSIARWVALDGATVLGHVQLTAPHDYILRHLGKTAVPEALAEVGKLFVATPAQGRGVGDRLLAHARAAAVSLRRQPVLAVLPTSDAAVRLYRRAGLQDVGEFIGVHGVNRVFLGSVPAAHNAQIP